MHTSHVMLMAKYSYPSNECIVCHHYQTNGYYPNSIGKVKSRPRGVDSGHLPCNRTGLVGTLVCDYLTSPLDKNALKTPC